VNEPAIVVDEHCGVDDLGPWRLGGPWFPGREVYAAWIDQRSGSPRLLAGAASAHWGPAVSRSDDLGATWREPDEPAIRFPADADAAVERVWQLQPGHEDEPEALYAGVSPAALFRSGDGGESFGLVRGLWDHPHRPQVAARRRRALPAHDR
jgi:hypothetical protein